MKQAPRVLLVEYQPDLRDLEALILSDASYTVESALPTVDPLGVAERTSPDVILIDIRATDPAGWQIVDQFDADPATRRIPLVVVSTAERIALEALAAPSVRATLVAPYEIDALPNAVAAALRSPPPAALLPEVTQPVPEAVTFAAQSLLQHARSIILRTIAQLQATEPYASHFSRLSPDMIDDLPVIFAAIVQGICCNLSPTALFAVPAIRHAVDRHVALRRAQGLGAATTIREYHALRDEIGQNVRDLIRQDPLTAIDLFDVYRQVDQFFAELTHMIAEVYCMSAKHRQGTRTTRSTTPRP
jgi:CheY-like chemotaxis protein